MKQIKHQTMNKKIIDDETGSNHFTPNFKLTKHWFNQKSTLFVQKTLACINFFVKTVQHVYF